MLKDEKYSEKSNDDLHIPRVGRIVAVLLAGPVGAPLQPGLRELDRTGLVLDIPPQQVGITNQIRYFLIQLI